MPSKRFNDAFERLARAEQRFLESEFLAPVTDKATVRVRIAGISCTLRITPPDFRGWGVFRPTSHSEAALVRPAGLAERREYLKLFPVARLVLCRRDAQGHWRGIAAQAGDSRLRIEGLVPVRLVDDAEQFETVKARYDGAHFWFDEVDRSSNPVAARYLREALIQRVPIEQLDHPGLRPEQRAAYAIHFVRAPAPSEPSKRGRRGTSESVATPEDRLREALAHAGAHLTEFMERGDGYRVSYVIGGRRHTSSVDKDDLSVQVAGICLSGQDEKFDLQSLVGVICEAGEGGEMVHIGEQLSEEAYWRMHPGRRRRGR